MKSNARRLAERYVHKLAKARWLPARHWYDLRDLMRLRSSTTDHEIGRKFRFVSDSFYSHLRSRELLSKEPETNAWLQKHLRPDDVFLDIGANIGIFSLFAGSRINENGHVYACEPHMPSAVQLMQNIAGNGLGDRISVLSVAIGGQNGFTPFRYRRWRSGVSGSQLDTEGGLDLEKAVGVELKCERTVDQLIEEGIIRPPNLIKMDTDGVELLITAGMEQLLKGEDRPRSLMVEVQEGDYSKQKAFMESCGYELAATALYSKSKSAHEAGASLDEVAFNAFFEPMSS